MYYNNPSGVSVHDGFPNPATDTSLQNIDLNRLLVRHSASTYFMRISGNDPAIWVKDDGFAISPKHKIPEQAEVWGSVTAVIHQYREGSNA
jgi:hypothetical protein